jgi:hypothetical protein
MERIELEQTYLQLGNLIEKKYPILSFKNHCYWRIANDNACQTKWDTIVNRPYYKNASKDQLKKSINILQEIFANRNVILEYNKQSLNYRNIQP